MVGGSRWLAQPRARLHAIPRSARYGAVLGVPFAGLRTTDGTSTTRESVVTAALASTALALPADFGSDLLRGIGAILLYALAGVLLMLLGFYAIDVTTPGKLSALVRAGLPNAVLVTASGLVSMALIVVVAIWSSASDLTAGLITALVFGLVGILAQVAAVRLLEWAARIDVKSAMESETFAPASIVVAAAHLALGLVVAVSVA